MLISLAAANVAVADIVSPIMEIQLWGSFMATNNKGAVYLYTNDGITGARTSVTDYLPEGLYSTAADFGIFNSQSYLVEGNSKKITLTYTDGSNALNIRTEGGTNGDPNSKTIEDGTTPGIYGQANYAFNWIISNILDGVTWMQVTQVVDYTDKSKNIDLGYQHIVQTGNDWKVTFNLAAGTFGYEKGLIFKFGDASTDPRRSAAVAAATPEPATLAIFGLGLAGLTALRRRKK